MKHISFMKHFVLIIKLCALGLLIGALGGVVGAIFAHLISFVTNARESAPWLLLLLPVGGIATVALYRVFRMSDHGGTNEMIRCLKNNTAIRTIAGPLIFVSTAITHLFGGSAGREGAALQLGGASASALSNMLRLKNDERTVFVLSGMSAVFAAVFGTPLTAAVFMLEFKSTKKGVYLAALPCLISAIVAKTVSSLMGVVETTVAPDHLPAFSLLSVAKIAVLAIGLGLLGTVTCLTFHKLETWAKKGIANPFLRAALGSITTVGLSAIVGDMRYSGSGIHLAMNAVGGHAEWFDFILKLVFTAVTLAAGFKGGEIIPTFCIGATFGCVFGNLLGLDGGFSAALGLVGLFCCAANSPVGAIVLGIEMFGFAGLPYYLMVIGILWLLSTKDGLFENRFFQSPLFRKIGQQKS